MSNDNAIGSLEVDMSPEAFKLLECLERILYDVDYRDWNKELAEMMIDLNEESWRLLRAICMYFRKIM